MLLKELLGILVFLLYYLIGLAIVPAMLKVWTPLPREVIRKTQHILCSLSIFILLKFFTDWYMALFAALLLAILAYPFLYIIERTPLFQQLFVTRSNGKGEFRRQLTYIQISFGLLIFLFWGLLGAKWSYVVAVAIMAWGFGDAAAALIGKSFGKNIIVHPNVQRAKTFEGTLAMIIAAFGAILLTLLFLSGLPWYLCLGAALITAPIAGIVELFSRKGTDTFTVPLATAAVIFPLVYLFSSLGW